MKPRGKFIWPAALVVGAFAIQAIGYAIQERVGDYALFASILLMVAAAGLVGNFLGRRLTLVAALSGAVIGLAYWFVDWQFIRLLRIHVLQQFTDNNISWIAGLYALLMWPLILLCAATAAVSAWVATRPSGQSKS